MILRFCQTQTILSISTLRESAGHESTDEEKEAVGMGICCWILLQDLFTIKKWRSCKKDKHVNK